MGFNYTVFPRNLAAARFYFKAPFGAATIRGRRLQRSTRTRVHSFNNKPICMHVKCACAYGNCCRPLTMRRDFEGGVYWDELADRCGDISRAAGFRGAARFRGNTVCACVWAWHYRSPVQCSTPEVHSTIFHSRKLAIPQQRGYKMSR